MSSTLTKQQVEDLLVNVIGVNKIMPWKGNKIQACCPIHGESNPSFGVNIDYSPEDEPNTHLTVFHCFSCGEGGTMPWLLAKSLPDQFSSVSAAAKFLKARYGLSTSFFNSEHGTHIKRYDDFFYEENESKRFEMPRIELAPFRSGKETYKYFYSRGFNKEDVKTFMIGRDIENRTVTIPAFWDDGKLAGIIGRYISKSRPKNSRFKIYNFPKGGLIYPLDKVVPINDTIIGVESMLDAIWLHKWGFPNTVAMMGDGMSQPQSDQIAKRCAKFIPLFDHDKGGAIATNIARKRLGDRVMFIPPTYYPSFGKDPDDWGELETVKVIQSATYLGVKNLPRL